MIKRIDPFIDTAFKFIFGTENQSEEILMSFLNEIFRGQEGFDNIIEIRYQNPEKVRKSIEGKSIIHDVQCETLSGRKFIVEIQNAAQDYFLKRALYYVSRGVGDQGKIGAGENDWEFNFKPVAGVFICNFPVKGVPRKLITHLKFTDVSDGSAIPDYMHLVFIQPKEFHLSKEECKTGFEKWIYVLKNLSTMTEASLEWFKESVFERLDKLSRYAALTPEQQAEYDRDLKWARDYNAGIKTAMRKGEENAKLEIAKKLKESGMPGSQIAEYTGLSLDIIESLF